DVPLLGHLHGRGEWTTVAREQKVATIRVQAVFSVDQIAMLLKQPLHAVGAALFLIRGEREDDVAIGLVALLTPANHVGEENGGAIFDVVGAAAVEEAVFFDHLKRVGGPIGAGGFDDIEMSEQQERLALAGSVNARDQVFLARFG